MPSEQYQNLWCWFFDLKAEHVEIGRNEFNLES